MSVYKRMAVVVYGGPKVDKAQSIPSLRRLEGACWMTLGLASKLPSKRADPCPGEGSRPCHFTRNGSWFAVNLISRIGFCDFRINDKTFMFGSWAK